MTDPTPTELWLSISDIIWRSGSDEDHATGYVSSLLMWDQIKAIQLAGGPKKNQKVYGDLMGNLANIVSLGLAPAHWLQICDPMNVRIPEHVEKILPTMALKALGTTLERNDPDASKAFWEEVAATVNTGGRIGFARRENGGETEVHEVDGISGAGFVWFLLDTLAKSEGKPNSRADWAIEMLAGITADIYKDKGLATIYDPTEAQLTDEQQALADMTRLKFEAAAEAVSGRRSPFSRPVREAPLAEA